MRAPMADVPCVRPPPPLSTVTWKEARATARKGKGGGGAPRGAERRSAGDAAWRRPVSAAMAAALASAAVLAVAPESWAAQEVQDGDSELVQKLLERTRENKAKYDQERLDNYYKRNYRINEITGVEIIPEPCDPRIPEFRGKCTPLPRLPQDRVF